MPQFSEDDAVSKKINEYFSSAPVPTQKEDEVLALIGDKCTRGCFLYKGLLSNRWECGLYVLPVPFVISWSRERNKSTP